MYIETVPNRNSPPCILLRESYRENGKVKKRTILNITDWPPQTIQGLRQLLKKGSSSRVVIEDMASSFTVTRSIPHGHVAAVLGMANQLGLQQLLGEQDCPERQLVMAMIVQRIINPRSKLATARAIDEDTASSTLAGQLGLDSVSENDLYQAMDWLVERQSSIETQLAGRHLKDGSLILYDVSSTWFEGRRCPLARRGYSRDGRGDRPQIVFGLLCDERGCPVAVQVFDGDTADPATLADQIQTINERFGLRRVVLVGDRGMITQARIDKELRPIEGLRWISALRSHQIRALMGKGAIQLSLFDERDLFEITDTDFPGERLVVCRNPLLAEKRRRTREELLQATQGHLDGIVLATTRSRRPLRGRDAIGLRAGKVLGRHKMGKHFKLTITDTSFSYERRQDCIEAEAALDGIYIIRSNVSKASMDESQLVGSYKSLSQVERAFRSYKTVDLKVRPIYHWVEHRVRAHVFLCMLAYYVEWHMRQKLAPMLFYDEEKELANQDRPSMVAPARRSDSARAKDCSRKTADNLPVHSFQSLLQDLSTIAENTIQPNVADVAPFKKTTRPTPVQQRAFDLLGVKLGCTQ